MMERSTKRMKAEEEHVQKHLEHRGFANIVYEPFPNKMPDFEVDGRVAIEVRRLNQRNFERGLEEVEIPLWYKMEKLVDSFGPSVNNESWFILFQFERPVEAWKTLSKKLKVALKDFRDTPKKADGIIFKTKGFELEVIRASEAEATMFIMGGSSDNDEGGWVFPEMEKNIRYCIEEKTSKREKALKSYDHWWLALVDHIGYGLNDRDCKRFRSQVQILHSWEKIIVIDPVDYTRWFEI